MKNIKQALKFDAISEIEKLSGKHHDQFNENEMHTAMSLAFMNNQMKKDMLKEINDTYSSMKFDEFHNLITNDTIGFQVGLSYNFDNDGNKETAILYYHKERGLIIWATSYYDSLNSAKLYGEITYNGEMNYKTVKHEFLDKEYQQLIRTPHIEKAMQSLDGFSHDAFMNAKSGLCISLDCRESMLYHLNNIEKYFSFNKIWNKKPFLWFLDYREEKEDYDYKMITNNKIEQSSIEVQNIINGHI